MSTSLELVCIYWNWGYPISIVTSMMLGWLWYGPLFNDVWMEYNHFSPRSAKRWQEKGYGNAAIVNALCAFIVMTSIVQYLVYVTNRKTALSGLYLGALLWVGFALPLKMVHYTHTPRKKKVIVLLDLTYQLSYFLIQSSVMAHFSTIYADNA
eukprot:515188_1